MISPTLAFQSGLSELRDNISFYPWMAIKEKDWRKGIYFSSCERVIQLYIVWGFPGKDTTLWRRNLSFYVEYTILTLIFEGRPAPSVKKSFMLSGRAEQIGPREGSRCTGTAGCWVLFSITGVSHQRAKVSSLKSLPCLPGPERRISFLDVTTDSTCPVCCPCQLCLPRCQSPVLLHAWILARLLLPLFNNFHGPCSLPVSPHWGMLGSLHRGLSEEGWTRIDAPWQASHKCQFWERKLLYSKNGQCQFWPPKDPEFLPLLGLLSGMSDGWGNILCKMQRSSGRSKAEAAEVCILSLPTCPPPSRRNIQRAFYPDPVF